MKPAESEPALGVLARAFRTDPLWRWVFDAQAHPEATMRRFWEILLPVVFRSRVHGSSEVVCTREHNATAMRRRADLRVERSPA